MCKSFYPPPGAARPGNFQAEISIHSTQLIKRGSKIMKKHISKHLVPFALACLVTVGLFTGCEKKPEKETQPTTVSTQEETTTSEEVVTTTTAPTTEAENPVELSVDMLTSHWLLQSIQSNYVFRFYADGTFESFFDCSSFDRSDKRLTYDSCGTYTLNGNELAIHVNASNYFSAFDYTVTYLRKDQHPEIKKWDIATDFPDDEWFFYETNFHGDPNYYDNARYFAWVDDDAFYDSCKITGRPSDKTNAADTSASKPTQATEAAPTTAAPTTAAPTLNSGESTDVHALFEAFIRNRSYEADVDCGTMARYCYVDLDQDGTDELMLEGFTGGQSRTYAIYAYDAGSGSIRFIEQSNYMGGLVFSPTCHTLASWWRSMNNGNPLYRYSLEYYEHFEMKPLDGFTYVSATKEYQDDSGKVLSDADVAKYLDFPELTFYDIP